MFFPGFPFDLFGFKLLNPRTWLSGLFYVSFIDDKKSYLETAIRLFRSVKETHCEGVLVFDRVIM